MSDKPKILDPFNPPDFRREVNVPTCSNGVPLVAVKCEKCGHLATLECLFVDCPFKQTDAPRDVPPAYSEYIGRAIMEAMR